MDELLNDFIAETRETAEAIAGEIVQWEADPADQARLDSIFRFVHTVKGSCGFLDQPRLERLSHAAEDALSAVRAGERVPDARLVTAVLAIIDRIRLVVDAIEAGGVVDDRDDAPLIAALAARPDCAGIRDRPDTAPAAMPSRTLARSIRVPVELLDRMMAGVSDLVLARNEVSRSLRDTVACEAIQAGFERLSASIADVRETITRTRMARVDQLFSALPRLARDVSADLGKRVTLTIEGGDVELDREMIEMVRDPLTHIVRNAIDHGIEQPADRVVAGKPAAGQLAVSARQSGNQILILVGDDGRGIDPDRVLAKAVDAGIVTVEAAARLDPDAVLDLIFRPGFSTADAVTAISGRGVGMDVVRANVERIGGRVTVESRPGQGLRVLMRVPMTLTIIPALTLSAGGQTFAMPRSAIEEIVRTAAGAVAIEHSCGMTTASIRGERLPLVALADVLAGTPAGGDAPPILIVVQPGNGGRYVLAIDAAHDHEELVVKPAAPAVMAIGLYGGVTMPDDNRPMLLLDAAGIAARAGLDTRVRRAPPAPTPAAAPMLPTLVFRDLDGIDRAIRLGVVERIDEVPSAACVPIGGHWRLHHDGVVVPLLSATGTMTGPGGARSAVRVLRLGDGVDRLGYAIDQVIDIVDLPADVAPVTAPGIVAGIIVAGDRLLELIDPHWMFAAAAATQAPAAAQDRPLALLAARDDGWMREILRPMVEAAGYRVAFAGDADGPHARIMIGDGTVPFPAGRDRAGHGPATILRLRAEPGGDEGIWRYDRPGLVRALDAARIRA